MVKMVQMSHSHINEDKRLLTYSIFFRVVLISSPEFHRKEANRSVLIQTIKIWNQVYLVVTHTIYHVTDVQLSAQFEY